MARRRLGARQPILAIVQRLKTVIPQPLQIVRHQTVAGIDRFIAPTRFVGPESGLLKCSLRLQNCLGISRVRFLDLSSTESPEVRRPGSNKIITLGGD